MRPNSKRQSSVGSRASSKRGKLTLIDVASFPVDLDTLVNQAHKQIVFPYFITWLYDCGFPVIWTYEDTNNQQP